MASKQMSPPLDAGHIPEAQRGLSEKEQSEVEEGQRPRAPVVYEIVRLEGERELRRPVWSLWWSGVAAAISIGFSALSEAGLSAYLPESQWKHAVASFGYSTGFIIVILGRQQLFTDYLLHQGVASHGSTSGLEIMASGLGLRPLLCIMLSAMQHGNTTESVAIALP